MNKIDTTTIGGEHVVYLIGGNPDFPIIKYYDYYCKVFGEILSRPVVPGDRFKDIREVEWHTNLAGVPESSTKELINEKIDECEKKRKEKIKDLEKSSPVNNEDKIKILNSFIFPKNEDDYKVIDGNLVLINWGLVKKEFETWNPEEINRSIMEDFGLEEVQKVQKVQEVQEVQEVPQVDPGNKEPGDSWENNGQFGAKNQVGEVEYFQDREAAESFARTGGWTNGNDWNEKKLLMLLMGFIFIIIVLLLLRNCNEDNSVVIGPTESTESTGSTGSTGSTKQPDPFAGRLINPPVSKPKKNGLQKIGELYEDKSSDPRKLYFKDLMGGYFLLPTGNDISKRRDKAAI